jgi:tetratricopeptide (TPR) repeat protein
MDKTRQAPVGMGTGLVIVSATLLVLGYLSIPGGPGLSLPMLGLAGLGGYWLAQQEKTPAALPWQLWKRGRVAAGLAGVLLVLLPVLLARTFLTRSSHPCLTRQVPAYPPPALLVTAEDYFAQGNYDYDRGDCQLAIADYSQAIARNPNYAQDYNNRAYTHMILQDYALALPDLDRAIQIRPGYVNALMNRGDIHNFYYEIDYEQAIADYDHVISLGALHTSVCGHRLLAVNHGWNLSAIAEVLTRGSGAGCPAADNVQ